MATTASGHTTFNMRMDKDLLIFLKYAAIKQECSMTYLVSRILSDYRKKSERRHANQEETGQD